MTASAAKPLAASRDHAFRSQLLAWYDANARSLPWRESHDPYRVWLSEIMLQQTRVAAVIAHYHAFLQRFPTVEKLARAREASVLAAWSGLGYYRRARMLHAAAKVVVRELGGRFPETTTGWRELPGIGRYTSAAIASIAFGEAVAVVDGNVERVLQRTSGRPFAGEQLWAAAEGLLDRSRPGDFNQALMELGAVMCTPRTPACLTCPIMDFCATRGELPGAPKSTRQTNREIHYALHARDGEVFLVQRALAASLMAGMWELPQASAENGQAPAARHHRKLRLTKPENSTPFLTLKHSITVTNYTVRVWRRPVPNTEGQWVATRRLRTLPLTGLARKILRRIGLLD